MVGQNLKIMVLSGFIFVAAFLLLALPATDLAMGANNEQEYFNLSLVIGNSAPSITGVANVSATPNEGTTVAVYILFNITDPNGESNVDPTDSVANITRNGVTKTTTSCVGYAPWTGGTVQGVNCTINLAYNEEPGEWNISVQGEDAAASVASSVNASIFTYNELYAFALVKPTISFTGSAGQNNVNASNDPQILNNTGNGGFTSVNVTGYELWNGTAGGDTIGAGNFTINATADSATGISVNGNVLLTGASLARNTTQDFYVWVDIPSGLPQATYTTNSSTQWLVEAYN